MLCLGFCLEGLLGLGSAVWDLGLRDERSSIVGSPQQGDRQDLWRITFALLQAMPFHKSEIRHYLLTLNTKVTKVGIVCIRGALGE